jgi:5-methylcytosine-specific restriction endonuclease McrA
MDRICTIRRSLVELCDGDCCAAILLNNFYYRSYSWSEDHGDQIPTPPIHTSIQVLAAWLLHMFDEQSIQDALYILDTKGFARIGRSLDEQEITYQLDLVWIDQCLDEWDKSQRNRYKQVDGGTPVEYPQLPPQTPTETQELPLEQRYKIEYGRVIYHCQRAEKLGLPATLTLEQWLDTLNHFNRKCAYCQGSYTVLEHFIPLNYPVGTTKQNCVPSCNKCNGIKGPYHPEALPHKAAEKLGEAIQTIQQYLESCEVEGA